MTQPSNFIDRIAKSVQRTEREPTSGLRNPYSRQSFTDFELRAVQVYCIESLYAGTEDVSSGESGAICKGKFCIHTRHGINPDTGVPTFMTDEDYDVLLTSPTGNFLIPGNIYSSVLVAYDPSTQKLIYEAVFDDPVLITAALATILDTAPLENFGSNERLLNTITFPQKLLGIYKIYGMIKLTGNSFLTLNDGNLTQIMLQASLLVKDHVSGDTILEYKLFNNLTSISDMLTIFPPTYSDFVNSYRSYAIAHEEEKTFIDILDLRDTGSYPAGGFDIYLRNTSITWDESDPSTNLTGINTSSGSVHLERI